MSQATSNLALPLMQSAQAQKHVTHNEALEILDIVAQLRVVTFEATTPPTAPVEGQVWALAASPTGDWAGQGGKLAAWSGGGWLFVTPAAGWQAFGRSDNSLRTLQSTPTGLAWVAVGVSAPPQTLPQLGINATADSTNRLAVASDATLLTHNGSGHQLKLNKATATQTGSLLYQTGFSGRAEMGLAGGDDFTIKVSANGTAWTEALRISRTDGQVSMPATRTRHLVPYNYRHYLYEDRRWTAPTYIASSTNAYQNLGTATVPTIYGGLKALYVPAGAHLRSFIMAGRIDGGNVLDMDIGLYFQTGPWGAGWTSTTGTVRSTLHTQTGVTISSAGGMGRLRVPLDFTAPEDGYMFLATRVGATSNLTAVWYFDCAGVLDMTCPPAPI